MHVITNTQLITQHRLGHIDRQGHYAYPKGLVAFERLGETLNSTIPWYLSYPMADGFVVLNKLDGANVLHHGESELRFDSKSEPASVNTVRREVCASWLFFYRGSGTYLQRLRRGGRHVSR